jgi:hypothetical protein
MNAELKKFLEFIVKPESRLDTDNYIASRKITDKDLILTVGYLNGSAWISGMAFDQLIKVRFNYFENSCGFYTTINLVNTKLPITKDNLYNFFEKGELFVGTLFENGMIATRMSK